MQLSDITILIPTIGRDSVFKAIKSIPVECNILVALDNKCGNHIFKYDEETHLLTKDSYQVHITDFFVVNYQCAGLTKSFLISEVQTPWFIILDDDDYFLPGTLNRFVQIINILEERGHNPKWIATHYCSESDISNKLAQADEYHLVTDQLFADRFDFIKSFGDFKNKYWEWIDGAARTDEYTLTHIYPCSEVLMSTKEFRQMIIFDHELQFRNHLLDDVIPTLSFMSQHSGVNDLYWGIAYTTPLESVSRSPRIHPSRDMEFLRLVQQLYTKYLNTHESLWLTALSNMLHVTNYNLMKYGNE